MIGNDVIDLELAAVQSNWKRKGFLDKIFTAAEKALIATAVEKDLMVWALWSRKEAAYKIFNRQTNLRLYNPIAFECSEMEYADGFYYGVVVNQQSTYFTKTEITDAFIHTIATTRPEDFRKVYWLDDTVTVLKKNGIPFRKAQNVAKPVSISDHGQFRKIISI